MKRKVNVFHSLVPDKQLDAWMAGWTTPAAVTTRCYVNMKGMDVLVKIKIERAKIVKKLRRDGAKRARQEDAHSFE